jgi:hypothetical protein
MFISSVGYNISCLGNTMDMISMHNRGNKAQMLIIGFFDKAFPLLRGSFIYRKRMSKGGLSKNPFFSAIR